MGPEWPLALEGAWRGSGSNSLTAVPEESKTDPIRTLMVGYQQGDAQSFEQLYAALAPSLRRYLLGLSRDAARTEDLLQETFLRIHQARHTFDRALPVEPWMYAIARHAFLMDRRKAGRRPEVPLEAWGGDLASPASSAEAAEVARDEIEHALKSLTEKRRGAVLLHHYHGLSFEEIGARLGIRAAAARLLASRGVRILRKLLSERRKT